MTLVTNLGMMSISVGTGIAEAHLLGPRGLGQLAAIQMLPMLVASIGLLGIPNAVGYFSAREPAAGRVIGFTGIAIGLAVAVFSIPLSFWLLPLALAKQDPNGRVDVTDISRHHSASGRWRCCAVGHLRVFEISGCGIPFRLLPTFAWVIAIGVTFILGKRDPGFLAAAFLTAYSLTTPLTFVVFLRTAKTPGKIDVQYAHRLLGYGLTGDAKQYSSSSEYAARSASDGGLVPAEALGSMLPRPPGRARWHRFGGTRVDLVSAMASSSDPGRGVRFSRRVFEWRSCW